MADAVKIPPRVPSTCAHNAILSSLIIHIIPTGQIYVAIESPSLIASISCLTTNSYLWNDVRAADNISHAENLQSIGCRCLSHLYKFQDRIQDTRVFRYCGERQGLPVLNESSIIVLEFDFEQSLQLPRETPIQRAITPPRALFYPHPVVTSILSAPALASCASTHLSYEFSISTLNLNLNTMVNTELHCMQLSI